jgi:hypothetical protein
MCKQNKGLITCLFATQLIHKTKTRKVKPNKNESIYQK